MAGDTRVAQIGRSSNWRRSLWRFCAVSRSLGLIRIEDRTIFHAAFACIVVCVSATCETQKTAPLKKWDTPGHDPELS